MKILKFFFVIGLLGICLSCTNRLTPSQEEEIDAKVRELATFLTDNYSVGDSLYFQHMVWDKETKKYFADETRGFVVTENYIKPYSKTILGTEDAEGLVSQEDGYKLITILQGGTDKLYIELTCAWQNKKYIFYVGTFLINDMKDDGYNGVLTDDPDVIKLGHMDATCILQRNVGIIEWWNLGDKEGSVKYGRWLPFQ